MKDKYRVRYLEMIENEIDDLDFDKNSNFKNPIHPYFGKPAKGNT